MDDNLDVAPELASPDMASSQTMATTTATATTVQPSSTCNKEVDTFPMKTPDALTMRQHEILNKLDLAPATLEALKTLSAISANEGAGKLSNCDKLTASLEQLRAKKNINLFEKLDKIKQEFSGINHKVCQMETSIMNMRKDTNNLVKSLPNSHMDGNHQSPKTTSHNNKQPFAAQTRSGK